MICKAVPERESCSRVHQTCKIIIIIMQIILIYLTIKDTGGILG